MPIQDRGDLAYRVVAPAPGAGHNPRAVLHCAEFQSFAQASRTTLHMASPLLRNCRYAFASTRPIPATKTTSTVLLVDGPFITWQVLRTIASVQAATTRSNSTVRAAVVACDALSLHAAQRIAMASAWHRRSAERMPIPHSLALAKSRW